MTLTAMLYVDGDIDGDGDERRAAARRPVGQRTTLRLSGGAVGAVLHDLSSTGASVETTASLVPGSVVTIGLAGVGRFPATVVSASGPRFGCRFVDPLTPAALRGAFASDPIVVGGFGERASLAGVPRSPTAKFPGVVRLALPIGGAIGGWALILHVARAVLG